jgi:YYY domain-containing protein
MRIFFLGAILGIGGGIFGFIALGRLEVALPAEEFWIGAWIFGALAFMNTWDFPFYLSLLFLVILWHQWRNEGWDFMKRFITTAFGLVVAGVIFYLPWYPTFSSQAGGILPNLIYPTRFVQFFIMFGPLLVPIFVWLVRTVIVDYKIHDNRRPFQVVVFLLVGLFVLSLLLGLAAYFVIRTDPMTSGTVFSHLGVFDLTPAEALKEVFKASFTRKLINPLIKSFETVNLLAIMLFIILGLVFELKGRRKAPKDEMDHTWIFVLFMIGIGTLLVLGPEFVYLKDSFGTRMNTIFKFYYAVWILWGLSAAYATIKLWPKKWAGLESLRSLIILPLLIGLLYPIISVWTKTNEFNLSYGPTLDGMAYREVRNPDEYEAILWINKNIDEGIVAEAVGGSYTDYARIATHTGLSTVLGWPGHELQWRGGAEEQGSRQQDIEKLYSTRSWQEAKAVVDQYGIDYVYVGSLERNTYQPFDERKFLAFMDVIFENDGVTIFAVNNRGVNP